MFTSLNPGMLGIKTSLQEGLSLAKNGGFEGYDFSITEATELATQNGVGYVKDLFAENGLQCGSWGMPVNFRQDEATWREGLESLEKWASVAGAMDCPRTATWILPYSDELTFEENMAFHVKRLKPIAEILRDHGCEFGLEYVGPPSMRVGHKYEFIHDLDGWRRLRDAIGTDNIGLLLDAFHWYVSGGTVRDLRSLDNEDIVVVHMNDAVDGIPREEQQDNVRRLPGETGVIDLVSFLGALDAIAYDGPLTVEPFSQRVREMAPEEAIQEAARALNGVLKKADLQ